MKAGQKEWVKMVKEDQKSPGRPKQFDERVTITLRVPKIIREWLIKQGHKEESNMNAVANKAFVEYLERRKA